MLALHRAYASVAEYSPDKQTLLPPARTIFANLKKLDTNQTGYDLKLARLAFPYMAHLFAEDWDDLERSARPALFDRVLLSDRISAEHSAISFDFVSGVVKPPSPEVDNAAVTKSKGKNPALPFVTTTIEATDKRLSFAPPFALPARADWAAPLRAGALTIPTRAGASQRKAITYVSTQSRRGGVSSTSGVRLREQDHEGLVTALRELGTSQGWDIHVIELDGPDATGWADSVRAAAQSSVSFPRTADCLGYFSELTSFFLVLPCRSATNSGWLCWDYCAGDAWSIR